MMWFAVCLVALFGLGGLHVYASERNHQRRLAEVKAQKIKEAEDALRKAIKDYPQDILLHASLSDRLKRLRKS